MDTSGNQEPQQTQQPNNIEVTPDIEVTPPEAITDVDIAINPNNEVTTLEGTPNTLEPTQVLKSLSTEEEIPVQAL